MPSDNSRRGSGGNRDGSPTPRPDRRRSWREGTSRSADQPRSEPRSDIGNRWRERNSESSKPHPGEAAALPDLEPSKPQRNKQPSSWAIALGAVLLLVIAGMIIAPAIGLFDSDSDPTPTPISGTADPTQVAQVPTSDVTAVPTNEPAQTVDSDFLVCIDPGHGGWDFGRERTDMAAFPAPWVNESEITLPLSLLLRDELESRGIAVVMTRESAGAVNWQNLDVDGDGRVLDGTAQGRVAGLRDELQARINICNDAEADIMISVHLNGFDDPSVGGYEIYYNSQREFAQENQDLAVFLYREMTVAFAEVDYAASERGWKDDIELSAATHEFGGEQFLVMIGPRVVKPEYTIEPTNMPGVIIETLFITSNSDANFILNPANQQALAVAWADGIELYRERYGDN